jgi:hypothetical protein
MKGRGIMHKIGEPYSFWEKLCSLFSGGTGTSFKDVGMYWAFLNALFAPPVLFGLLLRSLGLSDKVSSAIGIIYFLFHMYFLVEAIQKEKEGR